MALDAIDWSELAHRLDLVQDGPAAGQRILIGGSDQARRALEILIGEDNLRAAVDRYVVRDDGAELVRSVLWLLHPWSAMQRCHEIYLSPTADLEDRVAAVELLRVVADARALPWVRQYLDDPDEGIRSGGINIIDQLCYDRGVDWQPHADLLAHARQHRDAYVREKMVDIDDYLRRDAEPEQT